MMSQIAFPSLIAILALAGLAGLLFLAAWSDVTRYLIPNRICLAIACLYPVYVLGAAFSPGFYPSVNWFGAVILGLAVLAVGAFFFARGAVGGGDVKLLASTSIWAGPVLIFDLLTIMALTGGILALGAIARRAIRGRTGGAAALPAAGPPLPYGVAIAAGGLYVAARLAGALLPRMGAS